MENGFVRFISHAVLAVVLCIYIPVEAQDKVGLAGLGFAEAQKKFPEHFLASHVSEVKFRNLDGYVMCGCAKKIFKDDNISDLAVEAEENALIAFRAYIEDKFKLKTKDIIVMRRALLFQWRKDDCVCVNYYVAKNDVAIVFWGKGPAPKRQPD